MNAKIKTYQTNAHVWTDDPDTQGFDISYDFQDRSFFENEKEQEEWIDEELESIKACENYRDIFVSLKIATNNYVASND